MLSEQEWLHNLKTALSIKNKELLIRVLAQGHLSSLNTKDYKDKLWGLISSNPPLSLTPEEIEFFWFVLVSTAAEKDPEVKELLLEDVKKAFMKFGLTEGVHFQVGKDSSVIVSEEAKQILQKSEVWVELGFDKSFWDVQKVESNLGLPGYFEYLGNIAQTRLAPYLARQDYVFCIEYIMLLLAGTEEKVPLLELLGLDKQITEVALGNHVQEFFAQLALRTEVPEDIVEDCIAVLDTILEDISLAIDYSQGKSKTPVVLLKEKDIQYFSINRLMEIGKVWDYGGKLKEIILKSLRWQAKSQEG